MQAGLLVRGILEIGDEYPVEFFVIAVILISQHELNKQVSKLGLIHVIFFQFLNIGI